MTLSPKDAGDDKVVWEQFRKGDSGAFAALFELTSDRLYRYGTKFVKDEELVKDCIQELFIKLHENQSNLPDIEKPVFYLFNSLRNLLIDTIRRQQKVLYISPQELPFYVQFAFDEEDEKELEEEVKEKFQEVLSLLSDRQKEAIYLRFQADLSYEEISQLLGINYQSTRNLIHRSIEKIRSVMNLGLFIFLFMSILK